MESKLWIKLCALLLLFLSALASQDNDDSNRQEMPTVRSPNETLVIPATESGQGSSTISTTEKTTIPLIPLSKSNGTVTNSSELPEINWTFTEDSTHTTSFPVLETPPTEKSPPTSTVLSSTNKNDTTTVTTPTTTSHMSITNTSQPIAPVHTSSHMSITNTSQPIAPVHTSSHMAITNTSQPIAPVHTSTSKPTHSTTALSHIPQATATTTKPITSSITTQASTPASKPKMTTASTHSDAPSPSSQAKAHEDTPSQRNVGGDTTVVHEAPTLDPLLAGLVSAFIITVVIITLLLFLKLRRRDTRPEFRRLQDLPLDDMEDTPLSMYSY